MFLPHLIAETGYVLHPLGLCPKSVQERIACRGYNLWSGILSDVSEITLASTALTTVGVWWHHNNCIEEGCWRKGHKDPEHGHPICRKHKKHVHPAFGDKNEKE